MYIGGFKAVKNSKDLFKRLSILLIGIVFIYSIKQCEQSELTKPIDKYDMISGILIDKGIKKNQYHEKYFVRIKNDSITYKIEISKELAPKHFLKKIKINQHAIAWNTRSLGNIELVQLKMGNKYIIKHVN